MKIFVKALFLPFLILLFASPADSFIEKKFSLQEVVDQSTNVVFGTVISVDKKRQRAVVRVDENIKGTSKFREIKINVAVGQVRKKSSPKQMMEHFEVRYPVVIFYRNFSAVGHVDGTWFQLRGHRGNWWNFTHIEIYMHRTFDGTTEAFQRLIRQKMGITSSASFDVNSSSVKIKKFKWSPLVLQELEYGDIKSRKAAIKQLAELGHSAALLKVLDDPELSVRKMAVKKMIELDYSQGLVDAMNDEDVSIREIAARAVVKKFDIYGLKSAYNDSDEKIRNLALKALERNPAFTINIMYPALSSYDDSIRKFATSVLEDITGKNSTVDFYEWQQRKLKPGFLMTLYQGVNFENETISQMSSSVDFDWKMDEFSHNLPVDKFSVRWVGYLSILESKIYLFSIRYSGGIRFWLDGEKIISNWSMDSNLKTDLKALYLKQGYHSVRLEYHNNSDDGLIQLLWNTGEGDLIIPEENIFHLAVKVKWQNGKMAKW